MRYCEEYAALLDPFVDGELPPEEMERVRDHLAECPGCRAYVDDALAIRAAFPDIEDTEVPEGFAGSVMDRIREASAKDKELAEKLVELRRRRFRRWMGTAALAACCALVIFLRTGDGAAPAGGDSGAAYDTAGMIEGGEAGIALQTAPESEEAPAEGALENQAGPAAQSKTAELCREDQTLRAAPAESSDLAPAAAAPAAPETAAPEAAKDEGDLKRMDALYLTTEEAGELLDGFDPVWEGGEERRYELSAEDYQALLEALGRAYALPDAERFLVVVTGPWT